MSSRSVRVSRPVRGLFLAGGAVVLACAPVAFAGPDCRSLPPSIALPAELDESSGLTFGLRESDVLWTHNDDGSRLFAIDVRGSVLAAFNIRPRLQDWEDIAAGSCLESESCLYLADTGDNGERRADGDIRLIRITEPTVEEDGGTIEGQVFPMRLPQGARDVEAVFVLPGERLHLITKGRTHAITVYRYPPPLRADTVELEEVQRLSLGAAGLGDQVTGASSSSDGRRVAVRTYQSLEFFDVVADTLARVEGGVVNLRTLRESQGEAVAIGPDGLVVLSSEGGPFGGAPGMKVLRCGI